jgi:ribosomal protein S18 acetylase RimI-like enzyme
MAAAEASEVGDEHLYERSVATLVRSWEYLATGSPGAAVVEADRAAIAAFVGAPESEFLNNAVLTRGIADPGAALVTIERTYARFRVERYAVWVHESEPRTAAALEARGYRYDSSTRTMAMPIVELAAVDTSGLDVSEADPEEFWAVDGPAGIFPHLPSQGAHFYVARFEGESAAVLMTLDHEGDCGIYMVGTRPAARRRGLATAISAHAVAAARERGCTTASLQATAMAKGVYARVGFRDLGRFDEYTPAATAPAR